MKTTKKWYSIILSVIVIAIFLLPSVTFAAWYNPFTWSIWSIFKKSDAPVVVQVETISTSSPSVSTSTETKKDVAPVENKKSVTVSTPVQPEITLTPQVEIVDDSEAITTLERIKANAKVIIISREKRISEQREWLLNISSGPYSEEYAVPKKMINDLIKIYDEERIFAVQLVNAVDKTLADTTNIQNKTEQIQNAYLLLYGIATETNNSAPSLLAFIDSTIAECREIEKILIQLDETKKVLAENGVTASNTKTSAEIEVQRAKIQNDADSFIKNLTESQSKLQGSDQETRNQKKEKFKTVLYLFSNSTSKLPQ